MTESQSEATAVPELDVSIIVCSKNRGAALRDFFEHLARARVPADWQVELLIVDNGSSDDTKQVVSQAHMPNMQVRYVFEPHGGKSHALNTGVATCNSKVLLMTDDDVHVSADWIENMCRPILSGAADAVQGGIRIAPHLDKAWLKGVLRYWVAAVDNPAWPPEGLVGANMACSRLAFDVAGPCDPRLGPGAAGFFEDTALGWALERAGYSKLFLPDVAVEHHFGSDRLSFEAFLSTARRMAASQVIVDRERDPAAGPPSLIMLLKVLPGLGVRCLTQFLRLVINRQPDPGFMARYYRLRLWREQRKAAA
ncbi:glycosyltransferase [Phenylobacterium sp.]|jgi:GT2 family glycosyltransferase|uniref:glycosyltransferase n=1 Tax=Phenylobacterium sp. TaxID=1871053 RepID=UPI002F3E57D8